MTNLLREELEIQLGNAEARVDFLNQRVTAGESVDKYWMSDAVAEVSRLTQLLSNADLDEHLQSFAEFEISQLND